MIKKVVSVFLYSKVVIKLAWALAFAWSLLFYSSRSEAQSEKYFEGFAVEDFRESILKIWVHGLNPSTYWTASMEKNFRKNQNPDNKAHQQNDVSGKQTDSEEEAIELNGEDAAQNKKLLSKAQKNFLLMLRHLNQGSVNPAAVGTGIKLKQRKFLDEEHLLEVIQKSHYDLDSVVDELAPKNPVYRNVQTALETLYPACTEGRWQDIIDKEKKLKKK